MGAVQLLIHPDVELRLAGAGVLEAGAKGDWAEAYRLSQQRNHSVIAAKLARAYEKSRAQFDRSAKTLGKNRTMTGVDQDYLNWIHDLLMRTGYTVRRSVQDLQENIANVAFTMDAGTVSEPIDTGRSFHVIRLDARTPATTRTLADPSVKQEIHDQVRDEKYRPRFDIYLRKLWRENYIEVAPKYESYLVVSPLKQVPGNQKNAVLPNAPPPAAPPPAAATGIAAAAETPSSVSSAFTSCESSRTEIPLM